MTMIARMRLCLTAERDALVPDGHEDSAFLYAAIGDEIPDDAAERFGLVDGLLPGHPDEAALQAERLAQEEVAAKRAADEDAARVAQARVDAGADAAANAEADAAAKAEADAADDAAVEKAEADIAAEKADADATASEPESAEAEYVHTSGFADSSAVAEAAADDVGRKRGKKAEG